MARETAKLVTCLSGKHKGMSLYPQQPHKKLATAVHACHLSAGQEMETGGILGLTGQLVKPVSELQV